jgi:hypothetical protein
LADLTDVFSALKTAVLATLYPPSGTVPTNGISPVANAMVEVGSGWPTANDLDVVAASTTPGNPLRLIVSTYCLPGFQNTTRYPRKWQDMQPGVATLTASVDPTGAVVTLGGAVSSPQNVAVITNRQAFSYAVQPKDTLASIASGLAALISAATPASASGAAITIPSAHSLVARVGYVTTAGEEVMREKRRFLVAFWAPTPQVRDAASTPVKLALAIPHFLTLSDNTAARIVLCNDMFLDTPEKAGLYRRDLTYEIEYATFQTAPGPEAIAAGGAIQGSAAPISGFTASDPPPVNTQS